ncbi:hypothetical protein [Streptomyces sp. NRRL B-24720]|uniref:hypothetical protein n=1 Tax=Streptomyces sp. NRRL B-24720 TaxID=1476876 RepID=UPI0004CA809A|nr:hypothetical protein [Streptomyces sp. NRRL B-24720]
MNGVQVVLHTLHQGEQHLADELVTVADRHRTEHEVHHVATDVATWSREHVQRLVQASADHGLDLNGPFDGSSNGVLAPLRHETSERAGCRPDPGLLLLRDLRDLHLAATHNSLHWEMLAQVAQATKANDLLALASSCHPQTLRQMHWTNTMIKILSPQLLSSL